MNEKYELEIKRTTEVDADVSEANNQEEQATEQTEWVSEQFLNGTSAHIRLFSAIHSFSAVHGMVDLHKSWI